MTFVIGGWNFQLLSSQPRLIAISINRLRTRIANLWHGCQVWHRLRYWLALFITYFVYVNLIIQWLAYYSSIRYCYFLYPPWILRSKSIPRKISTRKYKYILAWRMPSSGMWRRVDLVWTTSQKTAFFIVTAVKISDLTYISLSNVKHISNVRWLLWDKMAAQK
jgi:hypothetical protein